MTKDKNVDTEKVRESLETILDHATGSSYDSDDLLQIEIECRRVWFEVGGEEKNSIYPTKDNDEC